MLHISPKGGFLGAFPVEALHYFDRLKNLARMAADFGNRLLAFVGEFSHASTEDQNGHERYRDCHQNDQAEFEVGDDHERQRAGERERVAHCEAHR